MGLCPAYALSGRFHFVRLLLLLMFSSAYAFSAAGQQQVIQEMVPMRDGVRLATDCYLPPGPGPFSAVLLRSVYGRGGGQSLGAKYNAQGFALIVQDSRGKGDSEGENDHCFLADGWGVQQDGVDTVAWILHQTWSDGKAGTAGASALGTTQLLLAAAGAPVNAQVVAFAPSTFYGQVVYQGGVLCRKVAAAWSGSQGEQLLATLQAHPMRDAFWDQLDSAARAEQVTAPGIHIGGWFDIFAQGAIEQFRARQHRGGAGARGNQKLVMGPWGHGKSQTLGEISLPDNWNFDEEELERRFIAHWLRGEENGVMREPAVHYYLLGAWDEASAPGNVWKTASDWPPPHAMTPFFLSSDGGLAGETPAEAGEQRFVFDPLNPCPTLGGANAHLEMGPHDQRPVSARQDVLKFMTPPLPDPLEVTGPVRLLLHVSTDSRDTDFTAKLIDVYPDGREMLLLDNIQRLKFREGFASPSFTVPGEIYPLEIDLWNISIVFNAGHRIALHVSSSNYPRFEVNPNTGEDFPKYLPAPADAAKPRLDARSVRAARNAVHFGPGFPSALHLPLVANP